MPLCIQHGRVRFYHYYPLFPASDKEGSLQNRPGTDYFQRNCNPDFTPVDMMDVGSSMTSFVGSGSGSETSVIESSSGGFSRPTSPQGKIRIMLRILLRNLIVNKIFRSIFNLSFKLIDNFRATMYLRKIDL